MASAESSPVVTSDGAAVPESRVERKRTQRMLRILDATADALGRQGISRFSLEEVAEDLDVTKGSLYHYFPSKEELVISAIERLGNRIMADLRAEIEGSDESATVKLRSLLDKQISVVVWDYPASVEIFTLREPEDAARRTKALRAKHHALFHGLIDEGNASGEFRMISPLTSLECMYSAINMAPLWIHSKSSSAARRQINDLIDTLMMLVGVLPEN